MITLEKVLLVEIGTILKSLLDSDLISDSLPLPETTYSIIIISYKKHTKKKKKLQTFLLLEQIGNLGSLFPKGYLDLGEKLLMDVGAEYMIVADEVRVSIID